MISRDDFLKIKKCRKCNNSGAYEVEIEDDDDQDEYGGEIGDVVSVKCSKCKLAFRKRELFLNNPNFDQKIMFYELDDYTIDEDNSSQASMCADTLKLVGKMCKDFEKHVMQFGGYFITKGQTNSGKSIIAHILAREAVIQGFTVDLISVLDLNIQLSGIKPYASQEDVFYQLRHLLNVDFLIIDKVEMFNRYFNRADLRRNYAIKIIEERLHNDRPTMLLTSVKISETFSNHDANGIPYDLPLILNKNYQNLDLYGKFRK